MVDAQKILADIDMQWDSVKQKFIDAQADYAKAGRYFQLLPTVSTPPKDGATKTPDITNAKPAYMDETTTQLVTQYALTLPTLAGLEIHQYKQPDGTLGWVAILTAQVTDDKGNVQTWRRVENMAGDEKYRTQDWHSQKPVPTLAK